MCGRQSCRRLNWATVLGPVAGASCFEPLKPILLEVDIVGREFTMRPAIEGLNTDTGLQ